MVIRRLAIRNFGKIHNTTLELSPGINVLYGENESGKTTLHTFVKCMLYGMHRSRGRAAKTDTYARYEPWENPSDYGGIMWFENGGKTFRIHRSFSREHSFEELFCENDGELLDIEEGDLDVLLGEVSETVYENTVSIAQLKSVTGRELVQELQNYMASYQGTGDASVDLGRAMQMMKMTRKGFQVQEERAQRIRQTEYQKLKANLDYISRELEELKDKCSRAKVKHAQAKQEIQEECTVLEQCISEAEQSKRTWGKNMIITGAAALLSAALLLFLLPGMQYLALIPMAAGAAAAVPEYKKIKNLEDSQRKYRKMLRRMKKKQDKLSWDLEGIHEIYAEKQTDYTNLSLELLEYEKNSMGPSHAQTEVDALNLAMDTMEELTERFRSQIGNSLRERTSEILSEITEGKYREVLIDADFHLQVNTENRIVPLENLSRGTLEQIYFALRMAAGELLCGEECFPVILDDVFGMYDEDRLAAVLHWLEKEPRQVIISTCSRREIEILKREGISFHDAHL